MKLGPSFRSDDKHQPSRLAGHLIALPNGVERAVLKI